MSKYRLDPTLAWSAILRCLTASRPICEVKQRQVWIVLGWVTTGEVQMLIILQHFWHLIHDWRNLFKRRFSFPAIDHSFLFLQQFKNISIYIAMAITILFIREMIKRNILLPSFMNTCIYHSNKLPAYIPLMLFDYKSGQDICTYKWCNPIHFVRTKWIGFASQSKWIIWKTFNLFDMTSKFHYYDYRQIQVFSLLDPWKLKHLKNLRKWLSNLLKTLLNFGLNCITRISKWSFRPFLRMVMNRLLCIVNQSNHQYNRRS